MVGLVFDLLSQIFRVLFHVVVSSSSAAEYSHRPVETETGRDPRVKRLLGLCRVRKHPLGPQGSPQRQPLCRTVTISPLDALCAAIICAKSYDCGVDTRHRDDNEHPKHAS